MVAGMDEKSRRLIAEAEARHRDSDDADPTQSPTGTWVMDDKTLAATMALPGRGYERHRAHAQHAGSGRQERHRPPQEAR